MNRNWLSLGFRVLPILLAALAVSHPAFAHWTPTTEAPELDPRLAIEGIAVAGAAAALIWERARRRR
jgi:hypothetical protein